MPSDLKVRGSLWRRLFPDPVSGLYAGTLVLALVSSAIPGLAAQRAGVDHSLADTYYVVLPLRLVVPLWVSLIVYFLGFRFFRAVMAVPYRRGLAGVQWLSMTLGFAFLQAPQVYLRAASAPEGYPEAPDIFMQLHGIASVGYLLSLLSSGLFVICVGEALWRRHRGAQPRPPERSAP
jgi:heme/copper-type cytochrome/quinol oxidase subunit 1